MEFDTEQARQAYSEDDRRSDQAHRETHIYTDITVFMPIRQRHCRFSTPNLQFPTTQRERHRERERETQIQTRHRFIFFQASHICRISFSRRFYHQPDGSCLLRPQIMRSPQKTFAVYSTETWNQAFRATLTHVIYPHTHPQIHRNRLLVTTFRATTPSASHPWSKETDFECIAIGSLEVIN